MSVDVLPTGELRAAKLKATTDSKGVAQYDLQIPGTTGEITRVIAGGWGYFTTRTEGDYLIVQILDPDKNLVSAFVDLDLPSENQGWWFDKDGYVDMKGVAGVGRLYGGYYLRIKAISASGNSDITFYGNIQWGVP